MSEHLVVSDATKHSVTITTPEGKITISTFPSLGTDVSVQRNESTDGRVVAQIHLDPKLEENRPDDIRKCIRTKRHGEHWWVSGRRSFFCEGVAE